MVTYLTYVSIYRSIYLSSYAIVARVSSAVGRAGRHCPLTMSLTLSAPVSLAMSGKVGKNYFDATVCFGTIYDRATNQRLRCTWCARVRVGTEKKWLRFVAGWAKDAWSIHDSTDPHWLAVELLGPWHVHNTYERKTVWVKKAKCSMKRTVIQRKQLDQKPNLNGQPYQFGYQRTIVIDVDELVFNVVFWST